MAPMLYTPEHAPRPLTEEHEEQVHANAMRILEEIGVDVLHERARQALANEGQKVEGDRVYLDRGFVMEQVAKAPRTFTLHARNPANSVEVGGGTPLWMGVGGPPFLSDLDQGRRAGTLEGHDTIIKLTQAASPLNCAQTGACEPTKMDVHTRHLDMEYSTLRWSDLPYTTYGTNGPKARDGIEMARIVHGNDLEDRTALMGVVNSVSPLIWDFRMVDALIAWAESNQATVVTPFLLGGATASVSVAGGLAQQVAEALSGVALAQTIRPGAPCLYGSFFQATDMRTGAPALGTPESIFGVFAGAQLARRYGLPFRGGGGLCSSNAVDAQAAAESAFMLWATVLAGTDVVLHAAGWLEGGLTASLEKFALDVELLEQFAVQQRGIGFSDEEFAFDALKEVGPGGLWLAAEHTMQHFREWQYISPLFITQDYTTWETMGGEETAARANRRWKGLLASYEDPGIDDAVDAELRAFMDRRKAEPPPDEEH
jgi:trimethylamine--corrinoid protein Co-methyltransferase